MITKVLYTVGHFHPSLTIVGKARSLLLEWRPVRGSTWVGSGLACIYQARVEVTDNNKLSSLL